MTLDVCESVLPVCRLENLLDSRNVSFGFLEMGAEGVCQIGCGGFFDHGGERLGDLAFHVESFLEVCDVEFVQRLEMFGCELHRGSPLQV